MRSASSRNGGASLPDNPSPNFRVSLSEEAILVVHAHNSAFATRASRRSGILLAEPRTVASEVLDNRSG